MTTTDLIKEIHSTYPTVPTSAIFPGKTTQILLIGKGDHVPSPAKDIPGTTIRTASEETILSSILRRDPVLAMFNTPPIPVRDKTGILTILLEYLNANRLDEENKSNLFKGETIVQFHKADTPGEFVRKTLLPFLELTKDLSEGGTMYLRSAFLGNTLTPQLVLCEPRIFRNLTDFKRLAVLGLPEISIHGISIEKARDDAPSAPAGLRTAAVRMTEKAIELLSDPETENGIMEAIMEEYLRVLINVSRTPTDFMIRNRSVLDSVLPRACSSLTMSLLPDASLAILSSRVKRGYEVLIQQNIETIPKSLESAYRRAAARRHETSGKSSPLAAYSFIFKASLSHPFHWAFVPYCIESFLPKII